MITGWCRWDVLADPGGDPWRDVPRGSGRGRPSITGIGAGPATAPGSDPGPAAGCCDEAEGPDLDDRGGRDGRPGASACGRGPAHAAGRSTRRGWRGRAERPGAHQGLGRMTRPGGDGQIRGGLTSKIHLLADSGCRPLARVTSAGQRHDSLAFVPLMAGSDRRRGPGRPRTRPGGSLATRPTPAARSALTCADAESRPPSPTRGPGPQPAAARQPGPATRLRPRRLQAAQHRRARLLPAPPTAPSHPV